MPFPDIQVDIMVWIAYCNHVTVKKRNNMHFSCKDILIASFSNHQNVFGVVPFGNFDGNTKSDIFSGSSLY